MLASLDTTKINTFKQWKTVDKLDEAPSHSAYSGEEYRRWLEQEMKIDTDKKQAEEIAKNMICKLYEKKFNDEYRLEGNNKISNLCGSNVEQLKDENFWRKLIKDNGINDYPSDTADRPKCARL